MTDARIDELERWAKMDSDDIKTHSLSPSLDDYAHHADDLAAGVLELVAEVRRLLIAQAPARDLIIKLPEDRGCGHFAALGAMEQENQRLRERLNEALGVRDADAHSVHQENGRLKVAERLAVAVAELDDSAALEVVPRSIFDPPDPACEEYVAALEAWRNAR